MDRVANPLTNYDKAQTPPGTPPVIDRNASAADAANLANDDGDSDFPGSTPAEKPPGEDDRIEPTAPPEVEPVPDSTDDPASTPDEVTPELPSEQPPVQPSVIPPPD